MADTIQNYSRRFFKLKSCHFTDSEALELATIPFRPRREGKRTPNPYIKETIAARKDLWDQHQEIRESAHAVGRRAVSWERFLSAQYERMGWSDVWAMYRHYREEVQGQWDRGLSEAEALDRRRRWRTPIKFRPKYDHHTYVMVKGVRKRKDKVLMTPRQRENERKARADYRERKRAEREAQRVM